MSSDRLAILADRTPNAVMLTDSEGRVQWLNRTARRVMRLSSADAAGITLDVVFGRLGLDPERQRVHPEQRGRPGVVRLRGAAGAGTGNSVGIRLQPHRSARGGATTRRRHGLAMVLRARGSAHRE